MMPPRRHTRAQTRSPFRIARALTLLTIASSARAALGMENFRFPNFQNRPHLNLNGDAVGEVGELVLTQAQMHQVGAAWFDQPVRVDNGFVSQFGFTITEVENTGGEGFAFVLQSAGPYSIGNSDAGLGYDGLGSGLAVEFDTAQSAGMGDPATPHISVHSGLFGAKLSAKEPELAEKYSSPWEDLALYDETLENRLRARFITIAYEPSDGILKVSLSHKSADGRYVHKDLISTQIGAITGEYHVGFTAATGKSFARFALLSWAFECAGPGETQSQVRTFCSQDFDGPNCAVTNEVAERECPRRTACNVCTEDVYNCAWCSGGNDGDSGHCVVGTVENIRECSAVALEPLSCSAGLSHIWIYLLGVAFFVIIVFAFVLFRMLPMVQSFRAISLLVALVGGALSGMVLSYFISISLVEISETTFFGIAYGFFFSVQFILISAHLVKIEIPERGWCSAHVILLIICDVWVFLSAIACFLLDRRFIHWLPEAPKVLFYTVLGASLNFCLVFSIAEITDEVMHKCSERGGHQANIASTFDTRRGTRRSAVVSSQARVALLAAASMLSGTFFGFMFGTLRIEEESQYRVALALQQEAAYTYPVGALIGGVSALLYQLVQLPLASDEQIDRILRESGRDGL